MDTPSEQSFLVRHEFLIRRLHSLSGLIPVGAFMCVHLTVNSTILNGATAFQKNVDMIHELGRFLPVVEWVFIFLPILFHAILGVVIIQSGTLNVGSYPTRGNYRYTLQRVTGMIAFFYIVWHVFHTHGWFHGEAWREWIRPLAGGTFDPHHASSTMGAALSGNWLFVTFYAVGVLACVFHLANGIWTMGITWGVWTSPAAQQRASWVCSAVGVVIAIIGMSALFGFSTMDTEELEAARQVEQLRIEARRASGENVESHAEDHDESTDEAAEESDTAANDGGPTGEAQDASGAILEIKHGAEEAADSAT